jgi:hypothetical protein
MKHILNNLSESEKNSIREQYSGKLLVETKNFKKNLNNKLGSAKPMIEEQNSEKIINEDAEQFSVEDFMNSKEGESGTWRKENGSIIINYNSGAFEGFDMYLKK